MAYTFSARELREFRAKHPEKAKHSFMVALKGNRHDPFGIWFENPEPFLRKNTFNYTKEQDVDWYKLDTKGVVTITSDIIGHLTDYAMHRMQFANFPPDAELILRENTEGRSIGEVVDHIFGNMIDKYTLPPMAQIYQDPRLGRYVATWFVLEINNDDAEDLVDFGYIIPVARESETCPEYQRELKEKMHKKMLNVFRDQEIQDLLRDNSYMDRPLVPLTAFQSYDSKQPYKYTPLPAFDVLRKIKKS